MRNIKEFDERYAVKTFYTDRLDRYEEGCGDIVSFLGARNPMIFRADQTHSANVCVLSDNGPKIEYTDETYTLSHKDGYDSIVTDLSDTLLIIRTADCTPIYMYDKTSDTIAMVHSGWRGTAGSIAVRTVEVMSRCFSACPGDIAVAIGPCICKECYEVGQDVYDLYSDKFDEDIVKAVFEVRPDGKFNLDVKKTVILDLIKNAGILPENIIDTGICTYESSELASYRRDGSMDKTAQMQSGIIRFHV